MLIMIFLCYCRGASFRFRQELMLFDSQEAFWDGRQVSFFTVQSTKTTVIVWPEIVTIFVSNDAVALCSWNWSFWLAPVSLLAALSLWKHPKSQHITMLIWQHIKNLDFDLIDLLIEDYVCLSLIVKWFVFRTWKKWQWRWRYVRRLWLRLFGYFSHVWHRVAQHSLRRGSRSCHQRADACWNC